MSRIDLADTTAAVRVQRMPRWYTGRSELIVAGGVLLLATGLGWGTLTMEVPEGTAFPGPQFFPTLVVVFLYAVGVALAVTVIVSPRRAHVAGDPTEVSADMLEDLGRLDETSEIRVVAPEQIARRDAGGARGGLGGGVSGAGAVGAGAASGIVSTEPRVDWRTVAITVGTIAAFIAVLPLIGWLLSAAALFWVLAWAFGSKRPLFDIAIAVIISSLVQLLFGAGLGLTLPSGILEGAFSWIS